MIKKVPQIVKLRILDKEIKCFYIREEGLLRCDVVAWNNKLLYSINNLLVIGLIYGRIKL